MRIACLVFLSLFHELDYYIWSLKNIIITFSNIGIGKKIISVFYQYQPIRKLSLLVGIGQYEKKAYWSTCVIYQVWQYVGYTTDAVEVNSPWQ